MRHTITVIYFFLLVLSAMAEGNSAIALADSAYRQKDYTAAVGFYTQALEGERNTKLSQNQIATIYYNLGNCHYRLKDYAHAVLFYQRSLRIDPSNDDAAFNLELTQTKLTDHFDAPSEMFFISWVKSFMQSQNSNTWGMFGLLFLLVVFICFAVYYFMRIVWIRKLSFGLTCVFCLAFIICQIFAWRQHSRYENVKQAVVMRQIDTFDTPTPSAKKQKTLHEGTLLTVRDTYKGGWLQVALPDNALTWIRQQGVEMITQ